jgi:hypothetical protein
MRLIIFLTGEFRHFWTSLDNLVDKVMRPAWAMNMEIYLWVGMDWNSRHAGSSWKLGERVDFLDALEARWETDLKQPLTRLHLSWIHKDHPYMKECRHYLRNFVDKGQLAPYWYHYLVDRSGSCIEYVQYRVLYESFLSKGPVIKEDDLLFRTRGDLYLRHPLHLPSSVPFPSSLSVHQIFSVLFPEANLASFSPQRFHDPTSRESSILWSSESTGNRWVVTLRKNLMYLLPMKEAYTIVEMMKRYGDWDEVVNNIFWFNAESQFRGYFRQRKFTVYEFSQEEDESSQPLDQLDTQKWPLYVIRRGGYTV